MSLRLGAALSGAAVILGYALDLSNIQQPLRGQLSRALFIAAPMFLLAGVVPWSRVWARLKRIGLYRGTKLGRGAIRKVQGFVDANHDTYNKAIALCKYALDNLGDPSDSDTRNQIVRVSYQRRMDDAEHARGVLFERLSRKARGVPEAFDNYHREYQAMRSWIMFAFDLDVLKSDWVGYAHWHIADQAFLTQLRTLIAAPELLSIKDRVKSAGWGEGVTSKLPPPEVRR